MSICAKVHEVTDMEYGHYSNEFDEEAQGIQAEADAEEACFEEACIAKSEGRTLACGHCGGCERGKALLAEMDEDRWQEEMKSAVEA
jgi:hypothetical protein